MAHALIWSGRARADLFDILAYIDATSPLYADAVAARFAARAALIPDHPRQGRRVPEYDGPDELREVFVHRWRIIYRVTDGAVEIVTILHGARLIDDVPL